MSLGWSSGAPVIEGLVEAALPLGVEIRTRGARQRCQGFEEGRWQGDGLELRLEAGPADGGIELLGSLKNTGGEPVDLDLVLFELGPELGPVARPQRSRAWLNGFQSWTPSVSVPADSLRPIPALRVFSLMTHHVDSPWYGRRDGLASTAAILLQEAGEAALLAGFTTHRTGHGEAFLQHQGQQRLVLSLDYDHKRLRPGEVVELERLWLATGEPLDLLEHWAHRTGQRMRARTTAEDSPLGWCSWYQYYAKVSERDVLANLAVLEAKPHLGVSTVQLDDGFQTAVGDWLSINRKFPRGLAPLAEDVRQAGLRMGIWTAPFWAAGGSRLFAHGPAQLLHGEDGKPVYAGWNPVWMARLFSLDLSHPATLDWLRQTFTELVEQGYDYHKIDFLFAGLRHGQRHDPHTSPVQAYRMGLAAIREAIGPERFLLGCGAPLGPSLGYVDAMRISQDVKESWDDQLFRLLGAQASYPSARGAIRNVMTRSALHRRLWTNDPDCVLVREHDTRLDLDETLLLVTVLGMSGGMLFLSDDLTRVRQERLDLVEAVLPPTPLTASPVDMMERTDPQHYVLSGPRRRLEALINWESRAVSRSVEGEGSCFDFWAEALVEQAEVSVPRHGVRALLHTPLEAHPHLVGTTLHLTALVDGRLDDRWEEGVLVLEGQRTARSQALVWVRCPQGCRLGALLPTGVERHGEWSHGVVLRITPEPDASGAWSLSIPFGGLE